MKVQLSPVPRQGTISISTGEIRTEAAGGGSMATQEHDVIRRWAARHGAEPATGEATASGPATIDVNDGGAGVRFNFPAVARFRPISWDEWFKNMDRHHLVFIYEEETADRAYALWQRRGGEHGHDHEDWFEAERQLKSFGGPQRTGYRFVQQILDAHQG